VQCTGCRWTQLDKIENTACPVPPEKAA
jgi:hypothetical protein